MLATLYHSTVNAMLCRTVRAMWRCTASAIYHCGGEKAMTGENLHENKMIRYQESKVTKRQWKINHRQNFAKSEIARFKISEKLYSCAAARWTPLLTWLRSSLLCWPSPPYIMVNWDRSHRICTIHVSDRNYWKKTEFHLKTEESQLSTYVHI